ncbi:MAG TPA: methyltransferase domain-containing protein [Acidobacteriota bacterium]|nr:methyltransferase domain-containing protein [Acidobacteriota bacterium]
MQDILYELNGNGLVLDLGCSGGSFDTNSYDFITIRVDVRQLGMTPGALHVRADAANLPFRARVFKAIVCNHSLEHFEKLNETLIEIGRVVSQDGALFVSVPDVRALTDRIYRWLARGGGHVNGFDSGRDLADRIESHTGLRCVGIRTLCTSFSFMNHRNARGRLPGRLAVFLWGMELPLVLLNALLRLLDRYFHMRTSVYGWALYFGKVSIGVSPAPWTNVCVRCGRGHPSDWLREVNAVSRRWGFLPLYRCPHCSARNVYFRDEDFELLR